jgi:hypothetical protein
MRLITGFAAPLLAAVALGTGAPAGDEFSDPSLAGWQTMSGDIGDGGATTWVVKNGQLVVHVAQSSWVNAQHAFYLWKTVDGDFDLSARVLTTGEHSRLAGDGWSLAGLLVRDPLAAGTPKEQWLNWSVGRVRGRNVFEAKTTQDGESHLSLLSAKPVWVDLRVVRHGATFKLYRRYAGRRWTEAWHFVRPDLGSELQVGVDAQSGFGMAADLVAHVDWVHFASP